jgi:hypothetical protein
MAKQTKGQVQFIFDTAGEWHAAKVGNYIFDTTGEWVAFVEGGEVWTTDGGWVGRLSRDGRIVRKRSAAPRPLREDIPAAPPKIKLPSHAPLPPMVAELNFGTVDVLEEDPDIFKRVADLRKDMD